MVRASALGLKRLKLLSDAVAEAVEGAPEVVDSKGWLEVKSPIESVEHAAMELIRVGAECEVVEPRTLGRR